MVAEGETNQTNHNMDASQAGSTDDASVTGGSPNQRTTDGADEIADAQSTMTGFTTTQIGGRPSPQRGWRITTMDNVQLCDWMEQMGASNETLEELQRSGTDGNELLFCLDAGRQTNENIQMVEKQLKLDDNVLLCMRLRQR